MIDLRDLIRLTLCFVIVSGLGFNVATLSYPIRDNYTWHGFDGNPSGLTDLDGKVVLPTIYANIRYVGNSIFIANEINTTDQFAWGQPRIFNKQGKELAYKVPWGTVFLDVFSLGKDADEHLTKPVSEFPKGTLLRFSTNFENGLCFPDGKVFIPLRPGVICYIKPGLGYSSPRDSNNPKDPSQFIDLETGKPEEDKGDTGPNSLTTRTTCQDDSKLNPNYHYTALAPYVVPFQVEENTSYRKISEDRLVRTVDIDDRQFHKDYWLEHRDSLFRGLLCSIDFSNNTI